MKTKIVAITKIDDTYIFGTTSKMIWNLFAFLLRRLSKKTWLVSLVNK